MLQNTLQECNRLRLTVRKLGRYEYSVFLILSQDFVSCFDDILNIVQQIQFSNWRFSGIAMHDSFKAAVLPPKEQVSERSVASLPRSPVLPLSSQVSSPLSQACPGSFFYVTQPVQPVFYVSQQPDPWVFHAQPACFFRPAPPVFMGDVQSQQFQQRCTTFLDV